MSRAALRLVGVCALVALAAYVAGGQPGARAGEPTVSPTLPPTAEPTPTPSPADGELAAAFARLGKVEEAVGAYTAVIAQGDADERLMARLALARVHADDGRVTAAVRQLEAYLLEAPPEADVRPAQLLLAEALAQQGDWSGALRLYNTYIDLGGGASLYARLGRALALSHGGSVAEASNEGRALLQEELPASARANFVRDLAQAIEVSQPAAALTWYRRLAAESDEPADQALVLWHTALIQRALGDQQAWTASLFTIIDRFPGTALALQAIDELDALGIALDEDEYRFGLVYYQNGELGKARAAFERVAGAQTPSANAARAAYYLAILDEDAGDFADAIDGYARVLELDPDVELADDALWWRGRLLERVGRSEDAAAGYERIVSEYGGSDWAPEARFRRALLEYDAGRYEAAAQAFGDIAVDAQEEERGRALLWQGKALAAGERSEEAEAVWRVLEAEQPIEYYGLRAAVLLGDAEGSLEDAGLEDEPVPDWPAIETWLSDVVERDPFAGLELMLFSSHWGLGQELLSAGLRQEAHGEFALLLEDAGRRPAELYQLARFFHAVGLADLAAQAATRLLFALPEEQAEAAPPGLWHVAYPAPFAQALREAVDEWDAPDVLLLAMVRQESFFDPLAGSPAGAIGLTQVIAPTGEAIAEELGVTGYAHEDLLRPSLSLRFGAYYLRQQRDAFDGNVYEALAAYNAGPGLAARWASVSGGDTDRFVAEIEFGQTTAYVRLVTENLARYQQLYGGLAAPALPED